jgi:hypothetical protein
MNKLFKNFILIVYFVSNMLYFQLCLKELIFSKYENIYYSLSSVKNLSTYLVPDLIFILKL